MGIPPPSWKACNDYSTPDTQPGFWGINPPASHGNTYVSLFTRGLGGFINDGYAEGIGAPLLKPMEVNNCYNVSIDLAFFSKAIFIGTFGDIVTYENPVALNVWGGSTECGKDVLLYRSIPITHEDWKTYSFTINPEKPLVYLTLEASYVSDINYGSILVDNIRIESSSLDLGADKILCQGSDLILNVPIPGSSIQWNTGSTEPTIRITESGIYSVRVEKGGCILKDSIVVQYLEPLTVALGKDTTLCPGDILTLNVQTARGNYAWNTGATNPILTVTEEGTYHVTVKNGCEEAEDAIDVSFDEVRCCNLTAPNIFTPNGDSLNELFEITSESTLQQFNLTIYNRWGNIVFESEELKDFWDGTSAGERKAAAGVYYWIATISCTHKDFIFNNTYRGTITLVR